MRKDFDLSLYLVTDRSLSMGRSLIDIVEKAVAGGVTMVQLREKDCSTREFIELAVAVKKITSARHIPLIINDRVDVALAAEADGVHVGQSDMSCQMVRRIMGEKAIIGLSIENDMQAKESADWQIDYIGISPVFSTPTKTDTAPPLGIEGIQRIRKLTPHPIVGIGGINLSNIPEIIQAGAEGVALVSAICSAPDMEAATHNLKLTIHKAKSRSDRGVRTGIRSPDISDT